MIIDSNTFEFIKNTLKFEQPEITIRKKESDNYTSIDTTFFGDGNIPCRYALYKVMEDRRINKAKFLGYLSLDPGEIIEVFTNVRQVEFLVIVQEMKDFEPVRPESDFVDEYGFPVGPVNAVYRL